MYFRDLVANHPDLNQLLSDAQTSETQAAGQDRSVALSFRSTDNLIEALAWVDGCVDDILLLPQGLDHDVASQLLAKAEIDDLFGDSDTLKSRKSLVALREAYAAVSPDRTSNWLLTTSGTTGTPKLVSHTFASLSRTAKKTSNAREFVWGQIYDNYRFAGLQVVIQAVLGGSRLIAPDWDLALCRKLAMFSDAGVNALSATPTLWRKILMTPKSHELDFRSITLGGEIVDQVVLDALHHRYPKAKIRHIYASTEAGAGFSVTDMKAGFPESFLDAGVSGVKLKVDEGRLFVKNDAVKTQYIGEKDKAFGASDGFIDTGDLVKIQGGRVFFLGRDSGVINVGGDKIIPEVVETVLNSHEAVGMSKVYGKKSSLMGQLVVADIQVKDGADKTTTEKALRDLAKSKLESFQRPVAFRFVDNIKLSDNGKVVR